MKIISVVNYKGGVGKSTLVSNMSSILAMKDKKVLIVDLDPQASLTFSYMPVEVWEKNYKDKKTIKVWYENTLKNRNVKAMKDYVVKDLKCNEILRGAGKKEVELIPSDINLYKTQIELAKRSSARLLRSEEDEMLNVISKLHLGLKKLDEYDYIIIDCQPSFDLITQSAIYASDYYIIPTKLDYLSTVGVQTLVGHVNKLKEWTSKVGRHKKNKVKLLGVVPSMVKKRKEIIKDLHKQYKSEIERNSIKVFDSSIRSKDGDIDNNNGVPMVLENLNRKNVLDVEKDFYDVVEELLTLI
ncbi:MAG: ParA family protein [Clostridium sp.]|uniref:ParA family protein n=1 Tax=Clostridium sp. TaxID=1506 RepID=UPI003F2E31A7